MYPFFAPRLPVSVSPAGETDEKIRNATGANGVNGSEKRRAKRAGRADDSLYRAARQAGLRGLANKFSITAAQLGEAVHGRFLSAVRLWCGDELVA